MNSICQKKIPASTRSARQPGGRGEVIPLTIPAHQAPALPLKLWRPTWFDATALCVGSAVPDLLYPVFGYDGHRFAGLLVVVPLTMLIELVLRRRAARVLFPQLPDLGVMRLRSYAAIGLRRPNSWISLASATLGALSHIVIDAFTHEMRWGSQWLGLQRTFADLPGRGEVSIAQTLQYVGHTVGSLIGVVLFAYVGQRRLMERWYGSAEVRGVRSLRPTTGQRIGFLAVTVTVAVGTVAVVSAGSATALVFAAMSGITLGLLIGGCVPVFEPREPVEPGGLKPGSGVSAGGHDPG